MSRAALAALIALTFTAAPRAAAAVDPHMDRSLLPGGCGSCHRSHGEPGSPMLPEAQQAVCLSCHGNRVEADKQIREGRLAAAARPPLLAEALDQAFTHPLSEDAYSRHETAVVTCTSCHSPHRGDSLEATPRRVGRRSKRSPRNPSRMEFELCENCHGADERRRTRTDIGALLNPNNPSYHPVEAPAPDASPSLKGDLSGSEISCTDCHGSSDPTTARGPHGSDVAFLLRGSYSLYDGEQDSAEAYALCYACHERSRVLASELFPEHYRHVVEQRVACATCHDPHGSTTSRSLIRFVDGIATGISRSASTEALAFDSTLPGSGSCYLTCHGFDHGPAVYGGGEIGTRESAVERQRGSLERKQRGGTGRTGRTRKPPDR